MPPSLRCCWRAGSLEVGRPRDCADRRRRLSYQFALRTAAVTPELVSSMHHPRVGLVGLSCVLGGFFNAAAAHGECLQWVQLFVTTW